MKLMLSRLFKNESFVSILLIFLITVITYGLSISRLGYYHDDWYLLWSGQARGAASIVSLFSTDRPFMGVIYSIAYRLLGDNYVNWHLYALIWRFMGGVAFFWILRLIWPKEKYITTLMTVLFIVYPGFLSQPNANTKQNHLYGFGTALFSIALMLQALKSNTRLWKTILYVLSVLLTINYLLIYEYMVGFEAIRLLLLGFISFRDGVRNIRVLVWGLAEKYWPYVVVTGGFVYWRIFLFESARKATDVSRITENYLGNIRSMSFRLILETAKDFLDVTIYAWFVMPYQYFSSARYSDLGESVFIALLAIVLIWLYTYLFRKWWGVGISEPENPRLIREFVLLGALSTIFAVIPVVLSERQVDLFDAYKSYGLHPIGGVVMLVFGIVLMFQSHFRRFILAALIGVSISTQVLNAASWGQLWEVHRDVWWQLTWRAPDIQDNTTVVVYPPEGFAFQQDYEIWGPINLIYRQEPSAFPGIQAEILNDNTVYDMVKGVERNNFNRDILLQRNFNNLLVVSLPSSSSCIHVLDGALPVYSESESLLVQRIGKKSRLDRILPSVDAPYPPHQIFGSEPEHEWCFYYQKASLARQEGAWDDVYRIYNIAISQDLRPDDRSEWFPYFESLVNLGKHDDARKLFKEMFSGNIKIRLPLCGFLAQDPGYPPSYGYDYEMIKNIFCE